MLPPLKTPSRRDLLLSTGWGSLMAGSSQASRPSIYLISCENLGPHLGCYGYPHVQTPAFDEFASKAIRFNWAFANSGVGPVSRAAIQTGMYPSSTGAHFDGRAVLPAFLKPFTELLKQAGYFIRTAKTGTAPPGQPVLAWKRLDATNPSRIRLRGESYDRLVKPLRLEARSLPPLPPQFEDQDEAREDWSNYHGLIALLDKQFAAELKTIPADAAVIFCAEYGFTLREGNSAAYESGTRVPLLIRGDPAVTDRLVMLMDLAPTVLHLAGIEVPALMQGRPLIGPRSTPARRHVYATVDRADLRYVTLRSVRDRQYRYVRNYSTGAEELYDSVQDPNEVTNLAGAKPAIRDRMREQLDRWRRESRDLGLIPEAELSARETAYRTRWNAGRQAGFEALQQRLSELALTDDEARIREGLADSDAAVRAVAAAKGNTKYESDYRRLLQDPSAAVRLAAARSIRVNSRQDAAALRTILRELRSLDDAARLQAAAVIEDLGEKDLNVLNALRVMAQTDRNRAAAAVAARILKGQESP